MRIALAIAALLVCACGDSAPPAGTPGVVLVTVDTLRADHTSTFGYDLETTPELTAVRRRGAAFTRCYSAQPETGPSISSILTSRHPRETGVRENGAKLPPEFPTLAEEFAAAGYDTAAFVSTYLLKPHACGLDRGFDVYDHEMTSANLGHAAFERRAEETVARALAWLDGREGGYFLWVHLYDPHGKYDPGWELVYPFLRDTGRGPLDSASILPYQWIRGCRDPDEYVARYDGEIFRADRALGDLFCAVGKKAIVAFTADHGEGLGEGGYWFRHGSRLDEAALRVPLVFAGPGVRAGAESGAVVSLLDVAPTLLDLAGLPPLPLFRGRSLAGFLADGSALPDREICSEARRMEGISDRTGIDTRYKVAVTGTRFRLVYWPKTGEKKLFDCRADPGQSTDLSAAHPAEAQPGVALTTFLRMGDRLPGQPAPADVGDALRGLGYLGGK